LALITSLEPSCNAVLGQFLRFCDLLNCHRFGCDIPELDGVYIAFLLQPWGETSSPVSDRDLFARPLRSSVLVAGDINKKLTMTMGSNDFADPSQILAPMASL
jgi:hypothetical protein